MKVKYGDQVLEIPYSHTSIENILNYFNLDQSKQELDLLSINSGFISLLDAFHLTDIGYDSEDTIEIIDCQPKNFYFKIKNNNYLYKRSIYKSTTVFEVKKYFSKAFFTVPQNIIIDFNGKKLQDDELLFEFNVTENSHFTVETINNYDLYYTFFGQFHFICLPQNSTFSQLKNTILAYSQKSVSIISNSFSYDEKLIKNCKQEGITNIDMIDQTKISEMIENVPLFEFSEKQSDKKCQNFPISIEFSRSQSKIYYSFYTINIYVVMCLLERDFCIERTLLNLFDEKGKKLNENDSVGPNCNNKLKLIINSLLNVKINGEFHQLHYLTQICDLKNKLNFEKCNFGIIINKHFIIDKNVSLLINYLNNSNSKEFSTNIIIKYSKEPCHEIVISKKNEKGKIFIIPDDLQLEQIANLYLHKNFATINIQKKGNNIEYSYRDIQIIPIDFFVDGKLINTYNIEIKEEEPRIIDLLNSIYNYSDKKIKIKKKFDVFDVSFNNIKLPFYEKISNILFSNDNKIKIQGFLYHKKYNSKNINIIDNNKKINTTIKYQVLKANEIIDKLASKHKIKYKNSKLFLDFNELKMSDIPTLYMKDDLFLILNDASDQKTIFVSNGTSLKIQIKLNKIQYSSIVDIIKSMFKMNDEEVEFSFKINDNSVIYKLPSKFDADSIPDDSLIIVDYVYKVENLIEFSVENVENSEKKIEISNINLPLNEIKQEIQEKLDLFDFSLNSFHFHFHGNKLDGNKKISDYKINSVSISTDKSLSILINIKEKQIIKYFSKEETIKDVKNLLKNQYKIDSIQLMNEKGVKYDDNVLLFNNMNIYLHPPTVNIFCNGSIGNRIYNVSEILTVPEVLQYIIKDIQKNDPSIELNDLSIFQKTFQDFSEFNSNQRLSEIKSQLYIHKIVKNIDFNSFLLKIDVKEKVSECNSIQWLIKNIISKKVLANPDDIIIKKNGLIFDENKLIYKLFTEGKLEIDFKFYKKTKIIETISKQKIIEESINFDDLSTNKNQINENSNDYENINHSKIKENDDVEQKDNDDGKGEDDDDDDNDNDTNVNEKDELFKELNIPIIDVNDFEIIKDIGKGQYGIVKLVENKKTQKLYAAKVAFDDSSDRKQILMEIKSQIIGENAAVLKLIGISYKDFEGNNSIIIFTEYMKNDSLLKNLENERKFIAAHDFTPTKKYIILLGIALGMKYLHFQGIIHRDLKPANVLLDENFYSHICDFGFSFVLNTDTHMTNVGFRDNMGTPCYMAPEIHANDEYSYKADVYAFSIIAYEILSGKQPYSKDMSFFRLLQNVVNKKRPDLSSIKDDEICKFITKCWADDPSVRPDFNEIVEEILKERYRNYFEADQDEIEDYLSLFSVSLKTFNCDLP